MLVETPSCPLQCHIQSTSLCRWPPSTALSTIQRLLMSRSSRDNIQRAPSQTSVPPRSSHSSSLHYRTHSPAAHVWPPTVHRVCVTSPLFMSHTSGSLTLTHTFPSFRKWTYFEHSAELKAVVAENVLTRRPLVAKHENTWSAPVFCCQDWHS